MKDDLVRRLRDSAKINDAIQVFLPYSGGNHTAELFNEAANAIEELQAAEKKFLHIISGLETEIEHLKMEEVLRS